MPGPLTSEFTLDVVQLKDVPEPEVRCTELDKVDWPGGAKIIANWAVKHGWDVRVTYARGWVSHATQDKYVRKHSVLLRISMDGAVMAGASWYAPADKSTIKYTFECGIIRTLLGVVSSSELKAWLADPTQDPRGGP